MFNEKTDKVTWNLKFQQRRKKKSTSRKENKHFVLRGPGKTHISSLETRAKRRESF